MNSVVRERLVSSAAASADTHPAELDRALRRGMRAFRLRLLWVQIAVVAVVVALSGGPLLAAAASGPGDMRISGTTGMSASDVTAITIEPSQLELAPDERWQLAASGTGRDGASADVTASIEWDTADASVAEIDADGTVSALRPGTTTITATLGDHRDTATVVVSTTAPTLTGLAVEPARASVGVGDELRLRAEATYSDLTTLDVTDVVAWSVQDAGVARVDGNGVLTGTEVGETSVTARLAGRTAAAAILVAERTALPTTLAITPRDAAVEVGGRQRLTATATYTDGTTRDVTLEVEWETDDGAVAQVGQDGTVTGRAPGTTTVIGSIGGERDTATVVVGDVAVVLSRITVTPPSVSIEVGAHQQFAATGTYSDGSTRDLPQPVRWRTEDSEVAQVDDTGTVTGTGTGTTTVTVESGDLKASATIVVAAPTARVTAITVTPRSVTGCSNLQVQRRLSAEGTYANGDVEQISGSVRWATDDAEVAVVDATGLVTGTGPGSTSIRAVLDGVEGTASVVLEYCEP